MNAPDRANAQIAAADAKDRVAAADWAELAKARDARGNAIIEGVLPAAAILIIVAELLDLPESLARVRRGVDDETLEIQDVVAEGMARSNDVRRGLGSGPR